MTIQTKHLFKILKVVKKTGILEQLKGFYRNINGQAGKSKEEMEAMQTELGMDIMISLIGGLDNAETEIYDLLADVEGKKIKEIQEQDPNLTIESIKEIATSDVFKGFLFSISK